MEISNEKVKPKRPETNIVVEGSKPIPSLAVQVEVQGEKKAVVSKPKARAEMIKKIMKEHNLSMIAASKYIKEKGISY